MPISSKFAGDPDSNRNINGDLGVAGTLTVDGATTLTGAVGVTGVLTPAAGVTNPTVSAINWVGKIGPLLATAGTDTACDNGSRFWGEIDIPSNTTVTGIAYLIGSVGGTDKAIVELHNSTGALVATSALAGTTVGTAANLQKIPFTAPYAATAGKYYIAVQFNGTTAKFRTHAIPGGAFVAASAAGTFGTSATITPGTTYTADKAPIACTY